MLKKIKFDLIVDGKKIENFKQLQDNICADYLDYIEDKRLAKWFSVRGVDDKANQVSEIDPNASPMEQMKALCQILELEEDEEVIAYLLEARDKRDKEQSKKLELSDIINIFFEIIRAKKEECDGKKDKV